MKFSIVTPCYNGLPFLQDCVRSIRDEMERFPGLIEHFVVDGGSTDGTVEYLKSQPQLSFISEPDEGISDAMNKGIRQTDGDVILYINADDELIPGAIGKANELYLEHPNVEWLQGSVVHTDDKGTVVGRQVARPELVKQFKRSTKFNQQAAFMRRSIFERHGEFSTDLIYVMDYDFWLRVYRDAPPYCVDFDVALYRMHATNNSHSNAWPTEYEKHLVRMLNLEALPGLSWAESVFYIAGTYFKAPSIFHYLAVGAARRGERQKALSFALKNLMAKPFQSPEHLLRELKELL